MPELPEVEAVCQKLRRDAAGGRIVQVRVERAGIVKPHKPAWLESQLAGAVIEDIDRRGKNIFLRFSTARVLHVHLRMTGNLYVIPDVRFRPAGTRVWFELESGAGLIYEDPRALGRMRLYRRREIESVLAAIGIEPLSAAFTPEWLAAAAAKSNAPAKLFLMDQRRIAGLGNIYAVEALYRAAIDPRKPLRRLRRPRIEALHRAIVAVLAEGVQSAQRAYGRPGAFNEAEGFRREVYDREGEPCYRCGKAIKRIPQGGRSTYFCAGCQR